MNKYRGKISNIKLNKRFHLKCVGGKGGREYINVKLQSTKVNCHFFESLGGGRKIIYDRKIHIYI